MKYEEGYERKEMNEWGGIWKKEKNIRRRSAKKKCKFNWAISIYSLILNKSMKFLIYHILN